VLTATMVPMINSSSFRFEIDCSFLCKLCALAEDELFQPELWPVASHKAGPGIFKLQCSHCLE
jgi:hypothetical protein